MKKYLFGFLFGVLLTAFSVYVILDVFVIVRVYTPVIPENHENVTMEPPSSEPIVTDTSYSDGNISIEITTHRAYKTNIYVADVKLASVGYLKTAFAKDSFGKNITEKTSEMAEEKGALLAINGDFYGTLEKGCVIRNGILYRSTLGNGRDYLVIGKDGSFEIVYEKDIDVDDLVSRGAIHVFSFGPGLILDGEIYSGVDRYQGIGLSDNPRTAIGMIDELHYVFVVCDGRTSESDGLTTRELAQFMKDLGVDCAYNLDGGGSSTMYFNGKIVNKPTTYGDKIKERSVSDIVYIGYR
ncbi:MAG: phosphodiester glycosidase family protein [Clostridia bacterium]|nr:phosphodiester glycosidase family protein [Clostridia bacterium]